MISKRHLIDGIRQHNNTATEVFLAQFDERALASYLKRVEDARKRVVRIHTRRTEPVVR